MDQVIVKQMPSYTIHEHLFLHSQKYNLQSYSGVYIEFGVANKYQEPRHLCRKKRETESD